MKTCPNCGASNFDIDDKCGKCAFPLKVMPFETVVAFPQQSNDQQIFLVKKKEVTSLQKIAKAFMVVSCVLIGINAVIAFILLMVSSAASLTLTPLWGISFLVLVPYFVISVFMTNSYNNKTADGVEIGIFFKIVTLLLISLIAGILMLCDTDSQ